MLLKWGEMDRPRDPLLELDLMELVGVGLRSDLLWFLILFMYEFCLKCTRRSHSFWYSGKLCNRWAGFLRKCASNPFLSSKYRQNPL